MAQMRSAVLPLLGITIVMFFLQQVLGAWFTASFVLVGSDILSRPWILLSSMFLHGSLNHLLFNMYGLFLFGMLLEQRIGPKRVLIVYLVCGVLAAAITGPFYNKALGASAALMGIIGALIVLMPRLQLLFFFFIPMPLWVAGIVWFLLDLVGIATPNSTANLAHIVGMAIGLGFGFYLRGKRQKVQKSMGSKLHLSNQDVNDYIKSGRI